MPRFMPTKELRKPSEHLRRILADNLRSLRRDRALSQEGLAEVCGLHRTYVGSVERGERNVSLSSLEVFAQALGVSVPELLTPQARNEHDQEPAP
jgi:transcriptional regulator with XRE-family HTH domain